MLLESFSIDDRSENVTFKMNSPLFKLCRVYSNSLKMWNKANFSGVDFLGTGLKLRNREKNSPSLVDILHNETIRNDDF